MAGHAPGNLVRATNERIHLQTADNYAQSSIGKSVTCFLETQGCLTRTKHA